VQGRIITDWMARWLKDEPTDLGPAVRYFRDYAYTAPSDPTDKAAALKSATAAYASAPGYPVGRATALRLSGGEALVGPGEPVEAGSAMFTSTGASAPTSSGEVITGSGPPQVDAPGTFARWTGAPQESPLDIAGIPELTVRLSAPQIAAAQTSSPLGKLQLFAKLYDVAPDGSRTLVKNLVAAARIPDVNEPARITLPGVVHRFDTGHKVQLVLSAADATYRGSGLGGPVTVVDDPAAPNLLSLPVTSRASRRALPAAAPAAAPAPAGPAGPGTAAGTLPATGASVLLPVAGALLLGAAFVVRRRRS
jgi:ABC-2 type transport system ATP-binding protein